VLGTALALVHAADAARRSDPRGELTGQEAVTGPDVQGVFTRQRVDQVQHRGPLCDHVRRHIRELECAGEVAVDFAHGSSCRARAPPRQPQQHQIASVKGPRKLTLCGARGFQGLSQHS
jgi:hypothetical protein